MADETTSQSPPAAARPDTQQLDAMAPETEDQGAAEQGTAAPGTTMPVSLPVSPQIGPYVVNVKEGETYLWCSCGLSKSQPFCDGSHQGTGYTPVAFEAIFDAEFHLCGCKKSDNKPYCFGNCRGHHRRIQAS